MIYREGNGLGRVGPWATGGMFDPNYRRANGGASSSGKRWWEVVADIWVDRRGGREPIRSGMTEEVTVTAKMPTWFELNWHWLLIAGVVAVVGWRVIRK